MPAPTPGIRSVPARTRWPVLLIAGSVVLQAAVQGTLTTSFRPTDSLLFTAVSFSLTTVIFVPLNAIHTRRRRSSSNSGRPGVARASRKLMTGMNVTTAITFLSFYLSISLIPAASASALETAVGPAALIALTVLVRRRIEHAGTRQRISTALLAILGCVLGWHTWNIGGDGSTLPAAVAGVLLSMLAGVGMAAVTLLSHEFGSRGTSPVTVTAHRFHLTYVLALLLWLADAPEAPSLSTLITLMLLGLLAVAVPLYCLQAGLQRTDPVTGIAVVITLPGVTYLVQLINGEQPHPVTSALLVAIMAVALFGLRTRSARVAAGSTHGSPAGPSPRADGGTPLPSTSPPLLHDFDSRPEADQPVRGHAAVQQGLGQVQTGSGRGRAVQADQSGERHGCADATQADVVSPVRDQDASPDP